MVSEEVISEATSATSELTQALDLLAGLRTQTLRYELENLLAVRNWAIRQLGLSYDPGDQVVISSAEPSSVDEGSGWYPFREALARGRTGVAGEISYSSRQDQWFVEVALDRAWSVHERADGSTVRFWRGPVDETPEGFEPPSLYNRTHHPSGRAKIFSLHVEWVRRS